MKHLQLAQQLKIGNMTIDGPLNKPGKPQFTDLASIVNNAVPLLFSIAGIILLVYILWGGFDFLTSMGDPKKAESGKNKITTAIIGFIIIFVSFWIVQIIRVLLNIP